MKHIRISVIFLLLAALACDLPLPNPEVIQGSGKVASESRAVSGFTKVVFATIGELEIVQFGSEALEIEAEDNLLSRLVSRVQDGVLYLETQPTAGGIQPTKPVRFRLQVIDLSRLEVSSLGNVTCAALKAADLVLQLSGPGNVTINQLVNTGTLDVEISSLGNLTIGSLAQTDLLAALLSGPGNLEAAGEAGRLKLELTSLGNLRAFELRLREADIDLSGPGNAEIWVTDRLDVVLSSLGNLSYYGAPALTVDDTGPGQVKGLGEK